MVSQLQVRNIIEEREESLSPHAAKSRLSPGRARYEEPCPVRTDFQRDRDRIIHAKAFRRLKHKTQVFIDPQGDHYVTRLTHTLEVSQIARTIARALNLNEDLTEAIALGHDLGHTPFGHIGEEVLNELYSHGFRHSEQSLRTVELLENNGQGLNLTWEVRDGIINHSKEGLKEKEDWGKAGTLEGIVVKIADIIAYINHDIDDAVRAGIITEEDLPVSTAAVLGHSHRERINTLVCNVIEQSWAVRGSNSADSPVIRISPHILEATNTLHSFLFDRVYNVYSEQEEATRAREIVRRLYRFFAEHQDRLPVEYINNIDEAERRTVDYIAGMTDQYALRLAEELASSK